jgi:hypothetical protein
MKLKIRFKKQKNTVIDHKNCKGMLDKPTKQIKAVIGVFVE